MLLAQLQVWIKGTNMKLAVFLAHDLPISSWYPLLLALSTALHDSQHAPCGGSFRNVLPPT